MTGEETGGRAWFTLKQYGSCQGCGDGILPGDLVCHGHGDGYLCRYCGRMPGKGRGNPVAMRRRLKSYVIYLAIAVPLAMSASLFISQSLIRGAVIGVIVFGGLMVSDRIQRKIWP